MKVLALILFCVSFQTQAMTVGKVNLQKALTSVKQGKSIQTYLKKEFKKRQKSLKTEETSILKLQRDFEKQSLVMNDQKKKERIQDIQKKMLALQQKTTTYQNEMKELEEKKKRPLIKRLRDVIRDVSKASNVDFTYEISSSPILYSKKEKDLTGEVISQYNKKYKK